MQNEKLNLLQHLHQEQVKKLYGELDQTIVDGLKRKGFEFDNPWELEEFIKRCCRKEIYPDGVIMFYAMDIPFLKVHWNPETKIDSSEDEHSIRMSATLGSYQFL